MENPFEDLNLELKDIKPAVREKALEILKTMSAELQSDRQSTIKKAIEEAENWFMDSEG